MEYINTAFKDLIICKPTLIKDDRGYFYESYNAGKFEKELGFKVEFVQDNQSRSQYGVVRGLHMQGGEYAQAKLVRCIQGRILDVVVDMRKDEPTFGKYFALDISEDNHLQLFIPRGFAHGFSVLSENAVFSYKCDNYYNKASEVGVAWDDQKFNINWQLPEKDIILSPKDQENPKFELAVNKLYSL